MNKPFSYLFTIAYYGARFKGWAKQAHQVTVEGKLEKVFRYVLGHQDFRLIGGSRTDAGVSCRQGFIQVFVKQEVLFQALLPTLNAHLEGQILLSQVRQVPRSFNLIQSIHAKTYRYFFSDAAEFHPFASAFVSQVMPSHSLEKMRKNAKLFLGVHNFKAFCTSSATKTNFVREIKSIQLGEMDLEGGTFFPNQVKYLEITGSGFLHHQVRKIMYAIWHSSLEEIAARLDRPDDSWSVAPKATAQGLVLWETLLDEPSV
ncbi:MAG: tRNA pseudouridine(38-40) synthase TruA [Algoriphagus sp.]